VGSYFEPKQLFQKDLNICVDSVDGHQIRSYIISKEKLWTGVLGLGGDDICVMGFSEVGCGDGGMIISQTYETMPLRKHVPYPASQIRLTLHRRWTLGPHISSEVRQNPGSEWHDPLFAGSSLLMLFQGKCAKEIEVSREELNTICS
jgi:hypothetical protein